MIVFIMNVLRVVNISYFVKISVLICFFSSCSYDKEYSICVLSKRECLFESKEIINSVDVYDFDVLKYFILQERKQQILDISMGFNYVPSDKFKSKKCFIGLLNNGECVFRRELFVSDEILFYSSVLGEYVELNTIFSRNLINRINNFSSKEKIKLKRISWLQAKTKLSENIKLEKEFNLYRDNL